MVKFSPILIIYQTKKKLLKHIRKQFSYIQHIKFGLPNVQLKYTTICLQDTNLQKNSQMNMWDKYY